MKIFWSYARLDNKEPARKVLHLKSAFEISLSQVLGKECEVFFDSESINWGVVWRDEIEQQLSSCDGFIATVTPSYYNSRACVYELKIAVDQGKKIYPIYFRTCKKLESSFKEDGLEQTTNMELNKASKALLDFQMRDFRDLRNKSLDSEPVQDFIDSLAEKIGK